MAITIQQQPDLYTPVYNPMRFVIQSSNNTSANFKYVVDLYVSGVSGRVWRGLYNANSLYGNAAADISRVLESYITYDLDSSLYGFQTCENSVKAYELKIGEQYGASSGITTYPNIEVTGTKYAWNGVFDTEIFRTYVYTNYTPNGNNAILSNISNNVTGAVITQYYYQSTNRAYQYMLNDTSGSVFFAVIKTYTNNALVGTFKIENPYQASSTYQNKMVRVGVGYDDLNNTTLYSGVQPVITSSIDTYTIEITDFFGNLNSPITTYKIDCVWHNTNPIALHWLNRLGGFDTYLFKLVTKKFSDLKRDSLQKNIGGLTESGWTYKAQDRGTTIFNTDITDKWTLESDWINDAQSIWLQELIESPEVYYYNGTDMIPVIVKNNGTEIKTIANFEKLFNQSVEIEFGNKRWTQRA